MDEPLTPNCPMCGQPPMMVMGGGTQAFCGNSDDCQVFTWNPTESPEEFRRTAKQVEILPSGNVQPGQLYYDPGAEWGEASTAGPVACPYCGVTMDPDSEGVPAHPTPLCGEFLAAARADRKAAGREEE